MQIKDLVPWAHKERSPESKTDKEEHPIASLQREIDRAFETFWSRFDASDWPGGGSVLRSDMVETDDAVEVSVELPGMEMKDVEVTASGDMLTIRGEKRVERQADKTGYYLSERSYGAIHRTIPLPPGVDGEKAEASFRNGVLTVKVPKTEEAQARVRRIEVQAA
jgi:HSP20 family protein